MEMLPDAAGRAFLAARAKNASRIEDDPEFVKPCAHQEHDPPMNIVIPAGKRLVHVCPGCGRTSIVRPPRVTM